MMKCGGCGNETHCCPFHGTALVETPEGWECPDKSGHPEGATLMYCPNCHRPLRSADQ